MSAAGRRQSQGQMRNAKSRSKSKSNNDCPLAGCMVDVGMFHASMSASGQGATFYPSSCPPAPLTLSQTPIPRRRTCLLSLWCGIYGGGMVWVQARRSGWTATTGWFTFGGASEQASRQLLFDQLRFLHEQPSRPLAGSLVRTTRCACTQAAEAPFAAAPVLLESEARQSGHTFSSPS